MRPLRTIWRDYLNTQEALKGDLTYTMRDVLETKLGEYLAEYRRANMAGNMGISCPARIPLGFSDR